MPRTNLPSIPVMRFSLIAGWQRTPLQNPLLLPRTPSDTKCLGLGSLKADSEMENCLQKVCWAVLVEDTPRSERTGKRKKLIPNVVIMRTQMILQGALGRNGPSEGPRLRQRGQAFKFPHGQSLATDWASSWWTQQLLAEDNFQRRKEL